MYIDKYPIIYRVLYIAGGCLHGISERSTVTTKTPPANSHFLVLVYHWPQKQIATELGSGA